MMVAAKAPASNYAILFRRLAVLGPLTFLVATCFENFLEPQLSPRAHQISEYAHQSSGGIITIAFLAWSLGLLALGLWLGGESSSGLAAVGGPLIVAAVGLVVTAVCPTGTVAGVVPNGQPLTLAGRLHDYGSGATTLALALAAGAVAISAHVDSARRCLSACALVSAVAASVLLLAVGDPAPGYRQRLLMLLALFWNLSMVGLPRRRR